MKLINEIQGQQLITLSLLQTRDYGIQVTTTYGDLILSAALQKIEDSAASLKRTVEESTAYAPKDKELAIAELDELKAGKTQTWGTDIKCPACEDGHLYTYYAEGVSGDPATGQWIMECDHCNYFHGTYGDIQEILQFFPAPLDSQLTEEYGHTLEKLPAPVRLSLMSEIADDIFSEYSRHESFEQVDEIARRIRNSGASIEEKIMLLKRIAIGLKEQPHD